MPTPSASRDWMHSSKPRSERSLLASTSALALVHQCGRRLATFLKQLHVENNGPQGVWCCVLLEHVVASVSCVASWCRKPMWCRKLRLRRSAVLAHAARRQSHHRTPRPVAVLGFSPIQHTTNSATLRRRHSFDSLSALDHLAACSAPLHGRRRCALRGGGGSCSACAMCAHRLWHRVGLLESCACRAPPAPSARKASARCVPAEFDGRGALPTAASPLRAPVAGALDRVTLRTQSGICICGFTRGGTKSA